MDISTKAMKIAKETELKIIESEIEEWYDEWKDKGEIADRYLKEAANAKSRMQLWQTALIYKKQMKTAGQITPPSAGANALPQ